MPQLDTHGVWEFHDGDAQGSPRAVSARRASLPPSYSAVLLDDQVDRLDLLLEAGARPSLDPATWFYVDEMGLCRLERHDQYAVNTGPRFVLRLVVCHAASPLQ